MFNIGEIALEQGHLDEAEDAFVAVNRTWRAAGYRSGAADAEGKLARVYAAQGRYGEALELFGSVHRRNGRHREPGGRARRRAPAWPSACS